MTTVLEIDRLTKAFGTIHALNRCTFLAGPKRLTGQLGPNGPGKTTLMRCLLGLVAPDEGTLRWRGHR